jgi:DNA-binding PadR family transcriptional regulator
MERDGLVSSSWEHSSAGPARRTYALLPEGTDWLHAWAGALRESHRYLSIYLGRYDRIIASTNAEAASGAAAVPSAPPGLPS